MSKAIKTMPVGLRRQELQEASTLCQGCVTPLDHHIGTIQKVNAVFSEDSERMGSKALEPRVKTVLSIELQRTQLKTLSMPWDFVNGRISEQPTGFFGRRSI